MKVQLPVFVLMCPRITSSGQVYQYSFSSSFSLEAGIKAVTSNLDNDVSTLRLEDNVWTVDSVFISYSTLHEQVGAAYVSVKWQIRNGWQLNSGLRYEYTHTTTGTATQKHFVDRKYRYVFPGFSLKKEFDKKRDLQFAYSRRITRPTYNDMAPSYSSGDLIRSRQETLPYCLQAERSRVTN